MTAFLVTSIITSPMIAQAESQEHLASQRTAATIKAKWQQAKPTYTGTPFVETPIYTAPYKAGKLNPAFINDGKRMVEFLRYLADVPPAITLNEELTKSSQAHTVVETVGYIPSNPHHPIKPADMTDSFYESSLIHNAYEVLAINLSNLSNAAVGLVEDNGGNNERDVGHRRSLLNPFYTSIGMGFSRQQGEKNYSVMRGQNIGENKDFDYDYIAWPNKGDFPLEYIAETDVWSFMLNLKKYEPLTDNVSVSIKSEKLGETWVLNKLSSRENKDNIFHVQASQITFFPQSLRKYMKSSGTDTFHVTIDGVRTKSGEPANIAYDVHLFPLENEAVQTKVVFSKKVYTLNEPLKYEAFRVYSDGTLKKIGKHEDFEFVSFLEDEDVEFYDKDELLPVGKYELAIGIDGEDSSPYLTENIEIVPPESTTIQALSAKVKSSTVTGNTKASLKVVITVKGKKYRTKSDVNGHFTMKNAAFKKLKGKQAIVTVYDKWNNNIAKEKVVFK